ncbi:MAG: 50S ribosomal protein L21 [Candidatus Giovannonibacteria bacterium GW2011_GWA2_45_21]|uniref:Large ribosomal subunit protein bL21 n=1 Tax=Candidatus Giovannonibacteria bacterium GW2011_GWA2_45_21 TaxID=1618649 RepID=A0A0G1M939_9BACT|nr:MAG: 50S ribosomal protein L21 [Candidatus Giovannonibacteria bacterium GW2011_GWA2_45_21]
MEFAVIQTGGKQYKVSVGETVRIEKLAPPMAGQAGEYKKGDKITFNKVLLVDNGKDTTIGTPFIAGAKVETELVDIGRAPKILVVKYKSKSRYLVRQGHRQHFFKVKILGIK